MALFRRSRPDSATPATKTAWQQLGDAVDAALIIGIAGKLTIPTAMYLIGGPSAAANSSFAGVLFLIIGFFVAVVPCALIYGLFRALSHGFLPARLAFLLTGFLASDLVPSVEQQEFRQTLRRLDDEKAEVQRKADDLRASLRHNMEASNIISIGDELPHGAALNARDAKGWTPLTKAVRDMVSDDGGFVVTLDWVRELLEAGADPDQRNGWEQTPLLLAGDHLPLLELLARYKADPNLCQGETLWWNLRETPTMDVIRLGVHFPQIGHAVNEDGEPCRGPLHVFAEAGRPALVQYFLNRGLDPNASPTDGTPLHFLTRAKGRSAELLEVADLLMAAGADPSARSVAGQMPEDLATSNPELREHLQMLRLKAESSSDRGQAAQP